MKAFIVMLYILGVSLSGFGQSEMTIPEQPIPSTQPESVLKLQNLPNPYPHLYNQNFEDMCLRYKAVETGGIILTVMGGSLIVTGAALLPHIHNVPAEASEYAQNTNNRQRTAAKVAIAIGAMSLTAGIPMVTFGALKARKACGLPPRHKASLQLQSGQDGAGIGLKF